MAKRLGVDVQIVLGILTKLGEVRYKSPADMLPAELTERVERAVTLAGLKKERPPPPAPAKPAAPTVPDKDAAAEAAAEAAEAPKPEPAASEDQPLSATPFAGALADVADVADVADAVTVGSAPAAAPTEGSVATPSAAEPPPEPEATSAVRDELEARIAGLERSVSEAERRAADAEDAWRKHDAMRKAAMAEMEQTQGELESRETDLKALRSIRKKDKAEAEQRQKDLRIQLDEAKTVPLRELLEERGITGPESTRQALGIILSEERAAPTLRSLVVSGPERLRRTLATRVFLWCGDDACVTSEPPESRVTVLSPACEACKGQTARRAAAAFVAACRDHDVKRVTIAGGSPMYRTQIQDAVGGTLDVRVFLNDDGRSSTQAVRDVEGSDLVIAWIATEVDHKFTELYTSQKDPKVISVPHRGISGMFAFVIEKLALGG